jgi:hypothetical protein
MKTDRDHALIQGLGTLGLLCFAWLLAACAGPQQSAQAPQVETDRLPTKIAVLPARYLLDEQEAVGDFPVDPADDEAGFIGDLARGAIHNQLAGKGYAVQPLRQVNRSLEKNDWTALPASQLCEKLAVDGLLYPEIHNATMMRAVAYDRFKIDARIRFVNRQGEELGVWRDNAAKRKIALPTSPVELAATVVGALLDEPASKQMRLVVYDWGDKVSHAVPDCPYGQSLPDVVSVESNIDHRLFAAGERIEIKLTGEKGVDGRFDLGEFKRNQPMTEVESGVYQGVYVVRQGDRAAGLTLQVRLTRPNGAQRIWVETGGSLTLDGILPPPPADLRARAGKEGVTLSWTPPPGDDVQTFVVEKSATAVGDFSQVARTRELRWLDAEVAEGATCYYRVRAVDAAGNRSGQEHTLRATMPCYQEVTLRGPLSGTLAPGVYRIEESTRVAAGSVLEIGPGTRLTLAPEVGLAINGRLKVAGSPQRPAILEGQGWRGIEIAARGQAELSHAVLKGCGACLQNSGSLVMQGVCVKGDGGDGLQVLDEGVTTLRKVEVSGCQRGVLISGGKAAIETATLRDNAIGLEVAGGDLELRDCNLGGNRQWQLKTDRQLVLEGHYLGASTVEELKLQGDILVESLLDAPYPQGRKIVLVDDRDITPEVIEERFAKHKSRGMTAFAERRFGDAHQQLTQAMQLKRDRETYLYLAYTQSCLGEQKHMAATLERAIAAFPYEVRLYQVYVKHLVASGQQARALTMLNKALKMNPDNPNLAFMKQYVEALGQ